MSNLGRQEAKKSLYSTLTSEKPASRRCSVGKASAECHLVGFQFGEPPQRRSCNYQVDIWIVEVRLQKYDPAACDEEVPHHLQRLRQVVVEVMEDPIADDVVEATAENLIRPCEIHYFESNVDSGRVV